MPAQTKHTPTLEESLSVKTIGGARISPDGRFVAYRVRETDWKENAYVRQIWLVNVATGASFPLTRGKKSRDAPEWSPDGRWLAFITERESSAIVPAGGKKEGGKKEKKKGGGKAGAGADLCVSAGGGGGHRVCSDAQSDAGVRRRRGYLSGGTDARQCGSQDRRIGRARSRPDVLARREANRVCDGAGAAVLLLRKHAHCRGGCGAGARATCDKTRRRARFDDTI